MNSLTNTMNEIFKNESWNNLNVFFENYETFEEIPLISRHKKVSTIATSTGLAGVAKFLVSTSFFVLNWAKLFARDNKINLNARFIAISFTDFDFSNLDEPPIPIFFVHSNETRAKFLNRLKSHEPETESVELLSIKNYSQNAALSPHSPFTRVDFTTTYATKYLLGFSPFLTNTQTDRKRSSTIQ
jgi:hypothetical protein